MTAEDTTPWLLVPGVMARARMGRREVLGALADGTLRGYQAKPGGTWRVHVDDVDAWLRGQKPAPVRPVFTRRAS